MRYSDLSPISHKDFSYITKNEEMPHIGRIKRSLVGEKHTYTDSTQMVLCMPSSYCWVYAICSLLENNEDQKEI